MADETSTAARAHLHRPIHRYIDRICSIDGDVQTAHLKGITKMTYPLHQVVLRCDKDAAKSLLNNGVSTNDLDNRGQAPLHWAVFGGYYEITELLLKQVADVNAITSDGVSPLWRALDFGLDDIAELIRSYGGKSICR